MLDINKFIEKMPKAELHFHLEGAIPIEVIFDLIHKYDKNCKINSIEELREKYKYKDFPHFVKTWHWQSKYLREYEDFTYLAEKTSEYLVKQNIRYIEADITPADFAEQHGLEIKKIVQAIRKGLDKNKDDVTANLIYDFNRDLGAEFASKQLNEHVVEIVDDCNIVGIGLGGQEHIFPTKLFEKVFTEVKQTGLKATIHAGEYAGPDSIWSALKICHADRIGHCTSAINDEQLLDYIKEKNIPMELCPISNVMTNVINSIKNHPIRKYYDKGLNISINTDDPTMFNTSLHKEYTTIMNEFDFSLLDIKKILSMTIDAAFCAEAVKKQFHKELDNYYQENYKA